MSDAYCGIKVGSLRLAAKRAWRSVAALSVAAGVAACDPCAGNLTCTTPLRAVAVGQVLDGATGRPLAGAKIEFTRTSGVATIRATTTAVTQKGGAFQLEIETTEPGVVIGSALLQAPGVAPYSITGIQLTASRSAGDATVMLPWSASAPTFPYVLEFFKRGMFGGRIKNQRVEFRRTGGVGMTQNTGNPIAVLRGQTDSTGWTYLFSGVTATATGDVIGDLVIGQPNSDSAVRRNFALPAKADFHANTQIIRAGMGASLAYQGEIGYRATGLPAVGIPVTFKRTGGIPVSVDSFDITTAEGGRFSFWTDALADGILKADITIKPPPPSKTYTVSVNIPTFETDELILFGVWGIGPQIPYWIVVNNAGVPKGGVTVDFKRTGGIAVYPATFSRQTNDSGIVDMRISPMAHGDVFGDITIRGPAPVPPFTVKNVKMSTVDDDVKGRGYLLGTWDLASPPTLRVP